MSGPTFTSPLPSWWNRPKPPCSSTLRSKSTTFRPQTRQQRTKNQKSNQIQRPTTVATHPNQNKRYTRQKQHARVLLAQRQRGTQSVQQQRLSNLLVESSLRSDPSFSFNNDNQSSYGQVSTNKQWMNRDSVTDNEPEFRSEAIKVEILLREALTAIDNHSKPNPFRTAVAFDALTQILPNLGGFERVMRTVSLELLASVYPKSQPGTLRTFENMPWFSMTKTRGQKITQLNNSLLSLQKKYDHVLSAQLASGGSINVVVLRWRKKVMNAYFNTWRTVTSIQTELKGTSARTMGAGLARRRFAKVFRSWRRWVTEELLERASITARIVGEQAEDLEKSRDTIRTLREELASRNEEIATLVSENGKLQVERMEEEKKKKLLQDKQRKKGGINISVIATALTSVVETLSNALIGDNSTLCVASATEAILNEGSNNRLRPPSPEARNRTKDDRTARFLEKELEKEKDNEADKTEQNMTDEASNISKNKRLIDMETLGSRIDGKKKKKNANGTVDINVAFYLRHDTDVLSFAGLEEIGIRKLTGSGTEVLAPSTLRRLMKCNGSAILVAWVNIQLAEANMKEIDILNGKSLADGSILGLIISNLLPNVIDSTTMTSPDETLRCEMVAHALPSIHPPLPKECILDGSSIQKGPEVVLCKILAHLFCYFTKINVPKRCKSDANSDMEVSQVREAWSSLVERGGDEWIDGVQVASQLIQKVNDDGEWMQQIRVERSVLVACKRAVAMV